MSEASTKTDSGQSFSLARKAGWPAAGLSALAAVLFAVAGTTTVAVAFAVLTLVWLGMALAFGGS
ncbi:MAG: hypothetical protein M3370_04255 [Actinomycetota bacterium]|nr:hypothetical protein [Actinomycetota bacterium]